MSLYNFKRLINKYSKYNSIIYTKVIGEKIDMTQGGKLVTEIEEVEVKGAIVGKRETANYDAGGVGITNEIMFYTYDHIEDNGKIIVNGDKTYTCMLAKDYSKFDTYKDGLRIYKLERGVDG